MTNTTTRFVAIPFDAIAETQPAHLKLVVVLLEFSDRTGKCWPSLRTLAERAGEGLSWVQRHLAEMEALGLFTRKRRRRGGSFLYQLAQRFLVFRRQDTAKPAETRYNSLQLATKRVLPAEQN